MQSIKLSLDGGLSPQGDILQIRSMEPDAFCAQTGLRLDDAIRPYVIIAVEGSVEDWAAYVGSAGKPLDWIRSNGLKLARDEAVKVFPILNPERYRR